MPLLRGLKPAPGPTSQAIDQLLSWDFVLSRDSVPAAIYVAWEHALKRAVWGLVVPTGCQGHVSPNAPCRPRS